MAAPAFKAAGTFVGSASTAVPGIPAGTVAGDILLLFVESENETISLSSAQGFAELGTQAGQGTAGGATSSRIAVFWKRATGSDSAPTVADAGDHVAARILSFSGCKTSGDPWDGTPTWTHDAVSDTTLAANGPTTTVDECLVVIAAANVIDTNTSQTVGYSNGALTSLGGTGSGDNTQLGTGGGFNVGTGVKATAGAVGATTVTWGANTQKSVVVLALAPPVPLTHSIDDTAALTDATTKAPVKTVADAPVARDTTFLPSNFTQPPVVDDFDRVESPLSQGGNWTSVTGLSTDGSNAVSSGFSGGATYSAESWSDGEVWITTAGTLVAPFIGLRVSGGNGYQAVINNSSITLQRIDAGAGIEIGRATLAITSGDKIGLKADGDKLTVHVKRTGDATWIKVAEATDATHAGPGSPTISFVFGGTFGEFGAGEVISAVPHDQDEDDTAALTDANTKAVTSARADTGSLTDAQSKAVASARADTAAATDASTRQVTSARADTASATDAHAKAITKTIADTAALTDARSIAPSKVLSDTGELTDASSREPGIGLADTANLTDSTVGVAGFFASISDTAAFTDVATPSGTLSHTKSIDDDLSATDATTKAVSTTLSDSASFTDALTRAVAHVLADTASATDDHALAFGFVLADVAALIDDEATTAAYARQVDDTAALTDASARSFVHALTETASLTDETEGAAAFTKALSDTAGLTDAQMRAVTAAIADGGVFGDSINAVGSGSSSVNDSVAATDAVTTEAEFVRSVDDGVEATDSCTPLLSRALTLSLDDTANFTDAMGAGAGGQASVPDTAALSDGLTTHFTKSLSDTAQFNDVVAGVAEAAPPGGQVMVGGEVLQVPVLYRSGGEVRRITPRVRQHGELVP